MSIEHQHTPEFENQGLASYLILILTLVGLFFTARVNYLLFHSLAEIFSIVVAFSLFMIAWHSRRYITNPYLLFPHLSGPDQDGCRRTL